MTNAKWPDKQLLVYLCGLRQVMRAHGGKGWEHLLILTGLSKKGHSHQSIYLLSPPHFPAPTFPAILLQSMNENGPWVTPMVDDFTGLHSFTSWVGCSSLKVRDHESFTDLWSGSVEEGGIGEQWGRWWGAGSSGTSTLCLLQFSFQKTSFH